jgi:hypothetical protein
MADLGTTLLFRMTHIENISHIIEHGITHKNSPYANPNFVPIGDGSLINARNTFKLSNGTLLGQYIPFYFGIRTPMLYVVQKGFNHVSPTIVENIIYCVSSVQQIIRHNLEFVFTDGHAVDSFSTLYYPADIEKVETLIDRKAVDAKYWKDDNDLDLKRRKEAEFLVLGDIPFSAIRGFAVYNDVAKNKLINMGLDASIIKVKTGFYF